MPTDYKVGKASVFGGKLQQTMWSPKSKVKYSVYAIRFNFKSRGSIYNYIKLF